MVDNENTGFRPILAEAREEKFGEREAGLRVDEFWRPGVEANPRGSPTLQKLGVFPARGSTTPASVVARKVFGLLPTRYYG